jgi:hypothetical protein
MPDRTQDQPEVMSDGRSHQNSPGPMANPPLNPAASNQTSDDTKLALERYRNILGYLQYENTIYWTRSGFMLVAHSALFGFLARLMSDIADPTWPRVGLVFFASIFGLVLSYLWTLTIHKGNGWIDRWHSILLRIEKPAYGDIFVFREEASDANQPYKGIRKVAEHVALLFRGAWVLGALVAVLCAVLKCIK